MSDNDRMDRARRIRQMREGQRDDDQPEESAESDDGDSGTAGDGDGDGTKSAAGGGPETAASGEGPPAEAGAAADTGDDGADDTADAAPEGMSAGTAETIETISGTTAEVPSAEEMEAAMEQTMEQAEPVEGTDASATPGEADEEAEAASTAGETTTQDATRVLEFTLAGEQYCLDIQYIEEIVKQEHITRVPNTPEFVEGVVDLRGQITTILNPKVALGKDDRSAGELIVVFDAESFEDQGTIGWVVDDVRQVRPVTDDQVNDPPMGEDYINGVIEREDDGEFVIWTTPDLALDEAG